jgi:hypothetical protein
VRTDIGIVGNPNGAAVASVDGKGRVRRPQRTSVGRSTRPGCHAIRLATSAGVVFAGGLP